MNAPAQRLGKYQLLAHLATGGMAEIFLARQSGIAGFEKLLVVKRILPHLAREKTFVDMFLDEARIAARLSHPNIVQIYDLGQEGDQLYIAMEYLEGESLAAVMRALRGIKRRLPHELALSIIMQVCDGLHHAHRFLGPDGKTISIIHRDVTPQNIFVLYSGVVKLIDFGIAKAQGGFSRTATGYLKGKYGYMSPEQINNLPLDGRSDIFAVGVVLWEILTGRKLFRQNSELEILKAITETDAPPPSSVDPSIPPEIDRMVLKALARNPQARYQTAAEMKMDLAYFLKNSGVTADALNLGEFMQLLFEQRIEKKREAIKAAQAVGSSQLDGAIFGNLLPLRPDTEPSILPETPTYNRVAQTQAVQQHSSQQPAGEILPAENISSLSEKKRFPLAAVLLPLVLGTAGFFLWQYYRAPLGGATAPVPAPTTVPPAPPPPPSTESPPAPQQPAPAQIKPSPPRKVAPTAGQKGGAIKKAVRMEPPPQTPPPAQPAFAATGKLRLSTQPWGTVYLGDRELGPTPLVDVELPAGTHQLRVVNKEAGLDRKIEVEIKPAQTTVRVVHF